METAAHILADYCRTDPEMQEWQALKTKNLGEDSESEFVTAKSPDALGARPGIRIQSQSAMREAHTVSVSFSALPLPPWPR